MQSKTKEVRRKLAVQLAATNLLADVWVRTWKDGTTNVGLVSGAQTKESMDMVRRGLQLAGYDFVQGMKGVSGEYRGEYVVTLRGTYTPGCLIYQVPEGERL